MSEKFELNRSISSQKRINEMVLTYKKANLFRYTNQSKYKEILNEYFRKEAFRRTDLFNKIKGSPKLQAGVLQHISVRENIPDFMCDWCWTYDPRLSSLGLPTSLPFIPFPRQLEFIEWFYNLYLNQESGLVEKSRDMGITWVFAFISVFEWRWTQGFAGGIGSNKLDNVDKKGEPDSIFEKIRSLINLLPRFWLPPEYDSRKHDKVGNLINPSMKSQIGGQGGREIGRGGRRSFYLVDEAASLEYPADADSALSQTTNCQIDLSTPKGMNHFGQKRHSEQYKNRVFTFHWRDDPRKNEEWYKYQCGRLSKVIIAQELDINYQASVEGLFIEPKWIEAAIKIKLKPVGKIVAGLDVAAGGSNSSSLAISFGPVVLVEAWDIKNGVDLTHKAIDTSNKAGVEYMHYDEIGVGHAVYSTITRTERKMEFSHFGLKASNSPSDLIYPEFQDEPAKNLFINARSEWWYITALKFEKTWEHMEGIRQYDESEMISIEDDGNLKVQLSSVKKFHTTTGKIQAESKTDLIKRGVASPDEADALILSQVPQAGGQKRIMAGIGGFKPEKLTLDWNVPDYQIKHYGVVVVDKTLKVHFMAAVWDELTGILSVYADALFDYPDPAMITDKIVGAMRLQYYTIDKLMGNKAMFDDGKKSLEKEINKHLWNKTSDIYTVRLKPPRKYDELGSLGGLMQLIKGGRLKVDISCENCIRQFMSWKLENSKFEHHGLQQGILIIISELMNYEPFAQAIRKKPEYSPMEITYEQPGQHGPMEA